MSSMMSKSLIGEEIKLGVDMHEKSYVVNAKIDGSVPLRSKRMSPSEFFGFVASILPKFVRLYCCYEVGCFCGRRKRSMLNSYPCNSAAIYGQTFFGCGYTALGYYYAIFASLRRGPNNLSRFINLSFLDTFACRQFRS